MEILEDLGRNDTKIRVRMSQRTLQPNVLVSQHDPIGKYVVKSLIYPVSGLNIGPMAQFRIVKVYHASFHEQDLLMLQRTVHGEFESFDDCYTICRLLDQGHLLKDFFLTYEFDSRIRLNYVFEEGETFPTTKLNDAAVWSLMKKCFKQLHQLRLNGVVVQELHPDNIQII